MFGRREEEGVVGGGVIEVLGRSEGVEEGVVGI